MRRTPTERDRDGRRAAEEPECRVASGAVDGALATSVLENLPDMVFAKDAESLQFIMMNRAGEELLGLSRMDLLTRTDLDFFPGSDADRFRAHDRATLNSGAILDIPEEAVPTRCGTRLVHTTKVPVCDKSGRPVYLMGISRDITDLHKLDLQRTALLERLQGAVRARDDILALVSHDLKNPLNAIMMSTRRLTHEGSTNALTAAQMIQRAATHMNHIIGNLIDAAAVEAGQFRVDPTGQDVDRLVDDAVQLTSPMTLERNQHLEQRVDGACPAVLCDRDLILQVFANLIGNASKFTPAGGAIVVSAAFDGNDVRFNVSDTGPGIPPEAIPHVFDRFWQARRLASASAGLGLYIVKGIVEAHGGTVWAENHSGGGASLSFLLPPWGARRAGSHPLRGS